MVKFMHNMTQTSVLRLILAIAFSILTLSGPHAAPKDALAGRTLSVMVGFSNSGTGARTWQVLSGHLRKHLPDTVIRAKFSDAASGIVGASDLFKLPDGSLSIGFVRPPELAFAQIEKRDGADFDLRNARWIASLENLNYVMAARKDLPLDAEVLRSMDKQLILPVSDLLSTNSKVAILLNAITGIPAKIVVGFKSSARRKAIAAGDADIVTNAADSNLLPLLKSGDVQSLYTIVGNNFPSEVDSSRTLEKYLVPNVPKSVVDFVKSTRGIGRAFFVPPGVSDQDYDSLVSVFYDVLNDPEFIRDATEKKIDFTYTSADTTAEQVSHLFPSEQDAQALLKAYQCGLDMSEGKIAKCDF